MEEARSPVYSEESGLWASPRKSSSPRKQFQSAPAREILEPQRRSYPAALPSSRSGGAHGGGAAAAATLRGGGRNMVSKLRLKVAEWDPSVEDVSNSSSPTSSRAATLLPQAIKAVASATAARKKVPTDKEMTMHQASQLLTTILERMFTDKPAEPLRYLSHCIRFLQEGGDVRRYDFARAAQLSARRREEKEREELRIVEEKVKLLNEQLEKAKENQRIELEEAEIREQKLVLRLKEVEKNLESARKERDQLRVQLNALQVIASSATAALDARKNIPQDERPMVKISAALGTLSDVAVIAASDLKVTLTDANGTQRHCIGRWSERRWPYRLEGLFKVINDDKVNTKKTVMRIDHPLVNSISDVHPRRKDAKKILLQQLASELVWEFNGEAVISEMSRDSVSNELNRDSVSSELNGEGVRSKLSEEDPSEKLREEDGSGKLNGNKFEKFGEEENIEFGQCVSSIEEFKVTGEEDPSINGKIVTFPAETGTKLWCRGYAFKGKNMILRCFELSDGGIRFVGVNPLEQLQNAESSIRISSQEVQRCYSFSDPGDDVQLKKMMDEEKKVSLRFSSLVAGLFLVNDSLRFDRMKLKNKIKEGWRYAQLIRDEENGGFGQIEWHSDEELNDEANDKLNDKLDEQKREDSKLNNVYIECEPQQNSALNLEKGDAAEASLIAAEIAQDAAEDAEEAFEIAEEAVDDAKHIMETKLKFEKMAKEAVDDAKHIMETKLKFEKMAKEAVDDAKHIMETKLKFEKMAKEEEKEVEIAIATAAMVAITAQEAAKTAFEEAEDAVEEAEDVKEELEIEKLEEEARIAAEQVSKHAKLQKEKKTAIGDAALASKQAAFFAQAAADNAEEAADEAEELAEIAAAEASSRASIVAMEAAKYCADQKIKAEFAFEGARQYKALCGTIALAALVAAAAADEADAAADDAEEAADECEERAERELIPSISISSKDIDFAIQIAVATAHAAAEAAEEYANDAEEAVNEVLLVVEELVEN
eukprot:g1893.t1